MPYKLKTVLTSTHFCDFLLSWQPCEQGQTDVSILIFKRGNKHVPFLISITDYSDVGAPDVSLSAQGVSTCN